MDVLSVVREEPRVLASRHVSVETSHPDTNISTKTLLCHSYSVHPDFHTYFAAVNTYAWVIWCCGVVILAAVCGMYVLTMRAVTRHWRHHSSSLAVIVGVYPVVAAAGLIALLIPRARLLSEAIAQEIVMFAMYQFFCVIIAESGGAKQLIERGDCRLETRVLPCCCWPCCVLPRPVITKEILRRVKYLVLQMPFMQTLIYVIILVLWSEDPDLYYRAYMYIQIFVAMSILSGMWGIIMSVRVAEAIGLRPRPRFLALQLVLLIVKLQCGLVKGLPETMVIPCLIPVHPSVFVHLIHNSLLMVEMLLLSIWAWRLYRVPPEKITERVQSITVSVVEESKDGLDNKSFKEERSK